MTVKCTHLAQNLSAPPRHLCLVDTAKWDYNCTCNYNLLFVLARTDSFTFETGLPHPGSQSGTLPVVVSLCQPLAMAMPLDHSHYTQLYCTCTYLFSNTLADVHHTRSLMFMITLAVDSTVYIMVE